MIDVLCNPGSNDACQEVSRRLNLLVFHEMNPLAVLH